MSTLKVSAIQNAAAGGGGLVLAADGNVSGAGLDLIVSQSFAAVSSVSVDDCFSADYDNYKVTVDLTAFGSGTAAFNWRFRTAGANNTTDTFNGGKWYMVNSGGGGGINLNAVNPVSICEMSTSAYYDHLTFDVHSPFLAACAGINGLMTYHNGTVYIQQTIGVSVNALTSYDGFSIYPASSTITGTVRVYGYRN